MRIYSLMAFLAPCIVDGIFTGLCVVRAIKLLKPKHGQTQTQTVMRVFLRDGYASLHAPGLV